jgi:outer membrane lipoprotein LolB
MFFKTFIISMLVLLNGCASRSPQIQSTIPSPPTPTTQTPAATGVPVAAGAKTNLHTKSASAITSWEIKGLMGVRSPKKSWSSQINWLQNGPSSYHIRMFGPMGGGTVLIDRSNGVVTYQDEHKKVSSKQASVLMKQQTGVALPVESLYYWVRGLPAPGHVDASHYGPQNQLEMLKQSGYTLIYTDYQNNNKYQLPTKLRLEGHGILIKLVIKSWRVG